MKGYDRIERLRTWALSSKPSITLIDEIFILAKAYG
jgi:hypothetical protein